MTVLSHIKGVMFDLDGVLYVGSQAIEGAPEAVAKARGSGRVCRFITNTSTLSLSALHRKLASLGIDVAREEIISAPEAAKLYLRQSGDRVCHLLLADDVKGDFQGLRCSESEADAIVVGDIGAAWSYELLNRVFNRLMQGAELIAIHKNRFWQTEEGLRMDIGGFVAALEYASGKKATIIGKPSADFFRMALKEMGLAASEVAVIGDDIDSDIGGGQAAGLTGILVGTGKYRKSYAESSPVKPAFVIDSVADFPRLLGV